MNIRKTLLSLGLLLTVSLFKTYAREVTFHIQGFNTLLTEPVPLSMEWNESWFGRNDTVTYDHEIARIACTFAQLSYIDVLADEKNNSLVNGYRELGVPQENIELHYNLDYKNPELGRDQCAFSFASREIESAKGRRTLVFITVRGTPDGANEWISNLNISDSSQKPTTLHEGFFKAAKIIYSDLCTYLKQHGINGKDAFVLITGHSRGAAVANMLAAYFADENIFRTQNVYAYTFAAPNVTTSESASDAKYDFIWNIVNAEDIVPTVPLYRAKWTYRKFGKTLTLVNYWNIEQSEYDEQIFPRVNEYHNKLIGRDYYPFRTGPFIPIQLTDMLNSVNKDVNKFYTSSLGLHSKGEAAFAMLFPDEKKAKKKKDSGFGKKISDLIINKINEKTGNLLSYASFAFVDMHAAETYLSYMLALDEKELFSTIGCSQIHFTGTEEGAVLDKDGRVLLQFLDGKILYSSIKLPVVAWNITVNKIAIGFPGNIDVDFVLTSQSLIPTGIPITIEHFDSAGVLKQTYGKQKLFPNKSLVYQFSAGAHTLQNNKILAEEIAGAEARELMQRTGIREKQPPMFSPEINMTTDLNIGYGIHIGTPAFYGTMLTGKHILNLMDSYEVTPGIGTQQVLYGPVLVDFEALMRYIWVFADTEKGQAFNMVPALRTSVSLKPLSHLQIFAAGVLDFNIKGFNDAAFDTNIRLKNMEFLEFTDEVRALPSLQFGIRF